MPQQARKTPIAKPNTASKICGFFILGLSVWCAGQETTSSATQPEATLTSSSSQSTTRGPQRNDELLAAELSEESQWLETSEGKILALYRPTEAKETKGALLLLHAAENPQRWPPELESLRHNLPRLGWETLAVSLPQRLPEKIPAPSLSSASGETEGAENSSVPAIKAETQNNALPNTVPREQLIKAYLLAALSFLNQKGQYNLVVLLDNSSLYWGMQLLAPQIKANDKDPNTVDGPLQALIAINLQPQEPLTTQELEASFTPPQLPVLDIFFAPDDTEQATQRERHRAAAMRSKLNYYQQVIIPAQPKATEDKPGGFLTGRVRGFMEKKAAGTEIEKNQH